MRYSDYKRMRKTALFNEFTNTASDAASFFGVGIIAAAALGGIGAGATWSYLNSRNKYDLSDAKTVYDNEHLKSQLGYLESQVRSEYDQAKRKQAPKAARVLM